MGNFFDINFDRANLGATITLDATKKAILFRNAGKFVIVPIMNTLCCALQETVSTGNLRKFLVKTGIELLYAAALFLSQ